MRSLMRKLVLGITVVVAGFLILSSGPRGRVAGDHRQREVAAEVLRFRQRKFLERIASTGPVTEFVASDDPPEVLWDVLWGLDYRTGEISPELQQHIGKEVKSPGFMVPLEDWAEEASEVLLVPYVGACVHTPPPPPNQLVYVLMDGGETVEVSFWDPVWIYGTLVVEETTNVYGAVSFKMSGTDVQPYEW